MCDTPHTRVVVCINSDEGPLYENAVKDEYGRSAGALAEELLRVHMRVQLLARASS